MSRSGADGAPQTDLRYPGRSRRHWDDALPHVLADITAQINSERRNRTCPRAVKRARHNSYRVKKPDEPASIRHDGPPTIHVLAPQAA